MPELDITFLDRKQELQDKPIKPIWLAEDHLKWAKDTYNTLINTLELRTLTQIKNLALYKGLHFNAQDPQGDFLDRRGMKVTVDSSKMVVNEIHEFVQQRVARLSRFTPTAVAVPHSNEHSDKEGAEATQQILETIGYQNDFQKLKTTADRRATLFGESFAFVLWNKDMGDLDERWLLAKEQLGNRKGTVEIDGKPFKYDPLRPQRIGDVEIKPALNWQLFFDPKTESRDVEWVMHHRFEHVEKVKRDHPELAEQIKPAKTASTFNMSSFYTQTLPDHVLIMEVWAKTTKYMPNGLYFKTSPDLMLTKPTDNPYPVLESSEFGNLPIERVVDIEVDGEFHGMSTLQVLAPLQHSLNQFYHMMKRSILHMGHPKLMVPNQGKININSLGNEMTVVRYNAPFKPETVTAATLPPEIFNMVGVITQKMNELGGIQPISKGDIPPNVRSGRAIRLLEELESLRATDTVKRSEQFIISIYRKTLSVISKFYKENDARLVRILGKDKTFKIDSFKASVLSKPYDVRALPSSNLPQTPAARIATVAELFQIPEFKNLLPTQAWADMLDLGDPRKFYDPIKAPVSKAEWENEEFIQGRVPPEPEDGDNHIVHWSTHNHILEGKAFLEFSEAQRLSLVEHQIIHEMEMFDKITVNPAFAQALLQLPGFPKFYTPPPAPIPVAPVPQQESRPQQQTQQSAPTPGTERADQETNVVP